MVVNQMPPPEGLPCDGGPFDWRMRNYVHSSVIHDYGREVRSGRMATGVAVVCVLTVLATAGMVGVLYVQRRRARPDGAVRYSRRPDRGQRVRYERPGGPAVAVVGAENRVYRDEEEGEEQVREMKTVRQWPPGECYHTYNLC